MGDCAGQSYLARGQINLNHLEVVTIGKLLDFCHILRGSAMMGNVFGPAQLWTRLAGVGREISALSISGVAQVNAHLNALMRVGWRDLARLGWQFAFATSEPGKSVGWCAGHTTLLQSQKQSPRTI